jgi:hypothetical protein
MNQITWSETWSRCTEDAKIDRAEKKPVLRPRFARKTRRALLAMTEKEDSAGERFRPGNTDGRKREGVSTVSLNHPLAANSREAGEICAYFNLCS